MTAIRVVDNHQELDGAGQLDHQQIDSFVTGSAFLVVSGTTPVPSSARKLSAGNGIVLTDEGPGGHLVVSTTTSTSLSGTLIAWMETPSGDADGTNTLFNVSNIPLPSSSLMFFVNGVLQRQGPDADYTMAGTLVSLFVPPRSDSNLIATYPYTISGGGFSWVEIPSGAVDGVNNVFTLTNIPIVGSLMLFVNGVLQKQGASADYTISGTTITLTYVPQINANILASYPY